MADPICRWRNPYLKTVREFINALPKSVMPSDEARALVKAQHSQDFYTTAYQLACQLGLYYEDAGTYYPKFTYDPTVEEIFQYLRNWIQKYYVPNPYTKAGFANLEPEIVHSGLCKILLTANNNVDWNNAKMELFQEAIGNDDILRNAIGFYSDVINVKSNVLEPKDGVKIADLKDYVFDLAPIERNDKAAFFNQFSLREENSYKIVSKEEFSSEWKHNLIMYGAPGTGKSHELEKRSTSFGTRRQRVTFYPDYSYAKFVGSYKPVTYYKKSSEETEYFSTKSQSGTKLAIVNEPIIDYAFAPGPFLEAIIEAFLSKEPYLLLIEEINRANAPAVFGEVFQLLDRKDGVSNYKVTLSAEAMLYLQDKLGEDYSNMKEGVYLPSNLYLWATMNSADQGVFHLDSAFKRRWGFEYLPLNENEKKCADSDILFCGKTFNWNLFRNVLNSYLGKVCNISEDRLIGPFFLTKTELLEADSIKNKLLLYLRDDVLRHNHRKLFIADTFSEITVLFNGGTDVFVQAVMEQLIIQENTTIEQ